MEKNIGSWFQHQHIDWRLPNLNSSCAKFELGQNLNPSYMNNPWNINVSTDGTQPGFAFNELPYINASQSNEPRGWFYCLPRYRQAFDPVFNLVPKEKPTSQNENCIDDTPKKKFLVFDQSGDRTTLIFSSGSENPVQYLPTSWNPKAGYDLDLNKVDSRIKRETDHISIPCLNDDDHLRSEMREDSEELDDLLYCDNDDDNYCTDDDDDVTSTGHSPSSLTVYNDHDHSNENGEEVDSYSTLVKRQKLVSGGAAVNRQLKCHNDEESSCAESNNPVFVKSDSVIGSKRSRKERIQTSVSILQSIIPGGIMGKNKNPILVLDEAISYLNSLKVKAEALGFTRSQQSV
jgi:hypothetical protein